MNMEMVGSLQNRLAERRKMPVPEIGMGATELMYSDRYPYEVVEIRDERHIVVREMATKMKEGTDWLDQEYEYSSDEKGARKNLFKTQKGRWVEKNYDGSYGSCFALGYAEKYRDPSF